MTPFCVLTMDGMFCYHVWIYIITFKNTAGVHSLIDCSVDADLCNVYTGNYSKSAKHGNVHKGFRADKSHYVHVCAWFHQT